MTASTAVRRRPDFDLLFTGIADYLTRGDLRDAQAFELARYCLLDSVGCACQGLGVPDCIKLIGPHVPGTVVPLGVRVPGTPHVLDPVKGAFDITCLVRWLDFNDTWLTGGHPSDNLGAVLAVADFMGRKREAAGAKPLLMRDVLAGMIQAYEIQGQLATYNQLDRPDIALDSAMLVKIASTGAAARLLGCSRDEILNAVSNAFVDGGSLNIYRKAEYAGSRKSWAAADATSRGVLLAQMALRGEMGYPRALTAKTWGFQDALFRGNELVVPPSYGTHVMRHIQFKVAYPAQRHSQTAAEAALKLHAQVASRLDAVSKVVVETHGLAKRMISAAGPLENFAARDHCMQYIVAAALIDGRLGHESYEDSHAADPRIDALRAKTEVRENPAYTRGYEDPGTRSNSNAVQVFFADGTSTGRVEVLYPLGDPQRRSEHLPLIEEKFRRNLALRYAGRQRAAIERMLLDQKTLEATPVTDFMQALAL